MIMTTYKVTKRAEDKGSKYFTNLMKAIDNKEYMKKLRKDGELYHIFGMTLNQEKWFELD